MTQTLPYVLNTMGTHITSAGMIEDMELRSDKLAQLYAEIMGNSEQFQYAKKVYIDDMLSGFILLGDTKAFASLNRQLDH